MNIPLLTPENLFIPLLYLLVMHRCIKALWGAPRKTFALCIWWGIYYAFQVIFSLNIMVPSQLLLIGNIVFVFIISCYYQNSLKQRCLCSLLICAVWMLVEIISVTILKTFALDGRTLWTAGNVITEMCMLIVAVVAGRCMKGKFRRDIPFKYFVTILMIPVCSVFLMHQIFLIAFYHMEYSMFAVSSSIILLLVSYVVFEVYDWLAGEAATREQNHLYEQQLELCSRQAEERESLYLELRRIRHDLKNHLSVLIGMVESGDREGAAGYIRNLLDDGIENPEEVSRSGNIVVDSLVNHKCALARTEGIEFDATVFLPVSLPFQSGHLAIIFGNLLQNAIDACWRMDEGKRYIRLEASYLKGMLQLTITNPYNGEVRRNRKGQLLTLKADKAHHGIGLTSVEQAAADYQGAVEIKDTGKVFQVTVVMYGREK